MSAILVHGQRYDLGDDAFAEIVIWELPRPLPGSVHRYKYRLAYVVNGVCVLRYDNESGKGDHRHTAGSEHGYTFVSVARLEAEFWSDVWSMQP